MSPWSIVRAACERDLAAWRELRQLLASLQLQPARPASEIRGRTKRALDLEYELTGDTRAVYVALQRRFARSDPSPELAAWFSEELGPDWRTIEPKPW